RVDVDVVDPHACSGNHPQVGGLPQQVGVDRRGRADQDAVVVADAGGEVVGGPVEAEVDVEAGGAQQLDAGLADVLLDQDPHQRVTDGSFSSTQSMQAVSASTSAGSTAGNMPTR